MKVIICNVHNDQLQNKFIKDFIIQINNRVPLTVLSENMIASDEKTADYGAQDVVEVNDEYVVREFETSTDNSNSDPFFQIIIELINKKILVKGLMNAAISYEMSQEETTRNMEEIANIEEFLNSLSPAQMEHDKSMLDYIQKEDSPFVAIVGMLHVVRWYYLDEISAEEFKIILPIHETFLSDLIEYGRSIGEIWNDKKVKMANDMLSQLSLTPDIKLFDVTNENIEDIIDNLLGSTIENL